MTLEYVVLQEPFCDHLDENLLVEARQRLGYIEAPDIHVLTHAIEGHASNYRFGQLQEIRRELKGLARVSRTIFRDQTTFEDYAFHYGGRTELQFNIGFEDRYDGEIRLRHGVAAWRSVGDLPNQVG